MDIAKAIGAILAGLLLLGAIGVGGWQFGWWLEEKGVDRRVGIENRNTGTQTAWRDRVEELMSQISLLPNDTPARDALIREACNKAGRLTDNYYTPEIEVFVTENCT